MRSRLFVASKSLGLPVGWLGVLLIAATLLVAPSAVAAEEHGEEEAAGEQHEASGEEQEEGGEAHEGGEEHGEEHHLHKHHIALFIGVTEGLEEHGEEHHDDGHGDPHSASTSSGEKGEPAFTLGFDYERRLTQLFGIGGMVDWVVEGNREILIGPIAFLHPFGKAKLFAAPCYERARESESNEFVFRVGASWDFEVGKFSVGPDLIYDFSEEHDLWVVGVGIGRGW